MIWRCPNCEGAFEQVDNGWKCQAGHSFDQARQGYVNLLLPNQKKSKDPGDNRAMVFGRRDFLQKGYYQPLVEAMVELILPRLQSELKCRPGFSLHEPQSQPESQPGGALTLLDLGCGEGFYLKALSDLAINSGSAVHLHGLDISREAVKLAASSLPRGQFCVASSYRVPVTNASVDVALQVFAPVAETEIKRILRARGVWLRVVPGPRHLYQLKSALYSSVREHQEPSMPAGCVELAETRVTFPLSLSDQSSVASLLAMTPFSWHGSSEGRQALLMRQELTTEADFVVQLFAVEETCS